ncbi:hypothetical protein A2U01_0102748, partial [Trifolium medium]|nr:hypothetical protein [Trifolium medium]
MQSSTVVDGITIDLKARWRILEYALKSRLQEVGVFLGSEVVACAGHSQL